MLVLLSFAQFAGRLLFSAGIPDADPIIYHLVMLLGLTGAVIASREHEHITIDIVSKFVTGRLKYIIAVLTGIFATGVCGILTWVAIRFVRDEIEFNDTAIHGVPIWVIQLSIPIAFALMSGRFLLRTSVSVAQSINPPDQPTAVSNQENIQ